MITLGNEGRISSADAARVRIAIASSLVTLPPRVETVIVVRHTAQPDVIWREERDRWSHELTDAALETLLAKARDAGFAVTTQAELLALPDADFVRAIWASSRPLPVDADYPMFFIYTSGSTGKPKGIVPRARLCRRAGRDDDGGVRCARRGHAVRGRRSRLDYRAILSDLRAR